MAITRRGGRGEAKDPLHKDDDDGVVQGQG